MIYEPHVAIDYQLEAQVRLLAVAFDPRQKQVDKLLVRESF
jgi:hypothetical protein